MIKHNFCANTFADLIIALKRIGKLLTPIYKYLLLPFFKLISILYLLPWRIADKHTNDDYNVKNLNIEFLTLFVTFGESVGASEIIMLGFKLISASAYSTIYSASSTFFSIVAQFLIGVWLMNMFILVGMPAIGYMINFVLNHYGDNFRHLDYHFKSLKVNTRDALLQKRYK